MRCRITHFRNAKKYEDNQNDPCEHLAGSLALANRSADVAAQNRAAKTNGGREPQPKPGHHVTVGLKDTFDAQREGDTGEDGEEKEEYHCISDDHSNNRS